MTRVYTGPYALNTHRFISRLKTDVYIRYDVDLLFVILKNKAEEPLLFKVIVDYRQFHIV